MSFNFDVSRCLSKSYNFLAMLTSIDLGTFSIGEFQLLAFEDACKDCFFGLHNCSIMADAGAVLMNAPRIEHYLATKLWCLFLNLFLKSISDRWCVKVCGI